MTGSYRVDQKTLKRGADQEAGEHPGLSERMHRRIARDHIERYGPGYYGKGVEQVQEKIIDSRNKELHAKPKRKVQPREYNPMTDGLPPHLRSFSF